MVAGSALNNGAFRSGPSTSTPGIAVRFAQITDGLSNTLFVGPRPFIPAGTTLSLTASVGWWSPGTASNGGGGASYILPLNMVIAYFGEAAMSGRHPILWWSRCGACSYPGSCNPTNACSANYFWSVFPGGGNWCMGDGSVRFISYRAAPVLGDLATIAGGETTPIPN